MHAHTHTKKKKSKDIYFGTEPAFFIFNIFSHFFSE